MSAVKTRIGRFCATLLGCGIVLLGTMDSVQAESKHCPSARTRTARKNGRTVLCSGSIGFHPTCWRTWPEGEPACPPIESPQQPIEKSLESSRRTGDAPKVRIEADAKTRESLPTSQKANTNGTSAVLVR